MIEGEDIDRLEALVDRYSLAEVLMSLSELCGRKAETIATTNASVAKKWCVMESIISTLCHTIEELKNGTP
jgi:phosphopantetheinyl transferase (holo-ACP synthase)